VPEHPFAEYLLKLKSRPRALAELRRVSPATAHEDVAAIKYLAGWAGESALGPLRSPFVVAILFAHHPAHEPLVPFAEAVRRLGRNEALDRRMERLLVAEWAVLPDLLRQMVQRLKGAGQGLDYGRLFADLERIETKRKPDPRLAWARTYYRQAPAQSNEREGRNQ